MDCHPPGPLISFPVERNHGLPTASIVLPTCTFPVNVTVARADRSAWVIREQICVRRSAGLACSGPVSDFFPQRLDRESQRFAVGVGYLRRSFPSRPWGSNGGCGSEKSRGPI